MQIELFDDKRSLGAKAAADASSIIRSAITARGSARIIAATGASQFDFLDCLTASRDVNWARVTMFHLDEYVGLSEGHPASFRRYLKERLASRVGMGTCHYLNPEPDPQAECVRVGRILRDAPVDVAFVGIGENGHLAFNDPPADFETEDSYLVVNLDERCRRQQLGEGWFSSLEEVPARAISMSIRQIMRSKAILCIVPEARKAQAVRATLCEPVSPMVPASILRSHPYITLYLDRDSASLLSPEEVPGLQKISS